ncbi:histidine ammonia-lyase [Candidatus Amarolinea dominans]|uniref:histidine ammonia-lyase n=1 Tax=Candidatus Amarolinea dominans TaxID=3140696 RepID=UPI001DB6AF05|nr:histidine ammonia-lyase [Anaerolineae bacterium]MBK7201795.1 histidine ammonia-lyase [Anaerolineae bacterium]MBK9094701.1 histidine ammonia-lyase [Anaerolineae bacterium]
MTAGFFELVLDGQSLTIAQVVRVAQAAPGTLHLRLDDAAQARVRRAQAAVEQIIAQEQVVYGITTGFGAFKNIFISPEQTTQLQRNILMSHAVGVGAPFPTNVVRAMMLIRANTLALGHSGVRPQVIEFLLRLLERGVHPVVPRQGSLGASGDLAPLAHVSLVLIGLGEAEVQGEILPGAAALARVDLAPLTLQAKEGLALTNGTGLMAALGCLAVAEAENAARVADIAGCLSLEALHGTTRAFDARIHAARPHPRQVECAARLRELLTGSEFTRDRPGVLGEDRQPAPSADFVPPHRHTPVDPQDAYTLRCIPQVHGACEDAIKYARWVVEIELNSATDNPLIFVDEASGAVDVISGGNFHGEPLAIAFDYLGLALTELGNMSERRLSRLLDADSNGHVLPPFLTADGGLNSGFMLVQYTAAALCSENKALVHPASADTIPTSANVEDHVSNGPIAGRQARRILRNLETILAMELLAASQGIDFRRQVLGPDTRLGQGTAPVYELVRTQVPFVTTDVVMYPLIETARQLVISGAVVASTLN